MPAQQPVWIVVSRRAVESLNLREPLDTLEILLTSPQRLNDHREAVDLIFDGYDDDPRDLWEIPEVRTFVQQLDSRFPYWLFFLDRQGRGLFVIARCLLLPHLTAEAERTQNMPKLAELLTSRWFPAMNRLGERINLPDSEIERMSNSAVAYFVGPPAKPSAELERVLEFATSDGRICPNASEWDRLYRMLPVESESGTPGPHLPLILSGWAFSSDQQKRERFHDHIRFADECGILNEVERYLRSLPERSWHRH